MCRKARLLSPKTITVVHLGNSYNIYNFASAGSKGAAFFSISRGFAVVKGILENKALFCLKFEVFIAHYAMPLHF
jgi:hypothetical protein